MYAEGCAVQQGSYLTFRFFFLAGLGNDLFRFRPVPASTAISKVVCAVLNASGGRGYFSKHLMTQAIKAFYKKHDLFPSGLGDNIPAVSTWAEKQGEAVARLVSGIVFQFCLQ